MTTVRTRIMDNHLRVAMIRTHPPRPQQTERQRNTESYYNCDGDRIGMTLNLGNA